MSSNIYDLQDTWNNGGTVFNGIKINVVNTASAVGSRLFRVDTNGIPQFVVDPVNGAAVGAAFGGPKGAGTVNAISYYINGVLFEPGNFQPADGDLTALASLTGTNTLYYRSGINTWSPVSFSGLTFVGGVLTATPSGGGGGNVSNSGVPAAGQVATWTDATHVQGVSRLGAGQLPTLTASTLGGRGSAGGTGNEEPITLGTGLAMTGTVLSAPAVAGFTSVVIQKFTSSGTYTPTAGMKYCVMEDVGGGGGGGGIGDTTAFSGVMGGGGSGSYSRRVVSAATVGASQTVTIGAGGTAGASGGGGGDGGNGGVTSVGTLCVANGGFGGGGLNTATYFGGAGGNLTGAVGDVTSAGAPGQGGSDAGPAFNVTGGNGASSFFGGGAVAPPTPFNSNVVGNAGSNYGGGGSGAIGNNSVTPRVGGAGSPGLVVITEYI